METNLDAKDLKILEILNDHADFTTRQIAKKTLLPVTTVHNRIRRLRSEGYIKKYTVQVDNAKLGRNFLAYVLVSVNTQALKEKKKTQYSVAEDLKKLHFVEQADIVSGGTDIIVLVRVRDVEEFDRCLLTRLQLIDGIEKTQSMIVIHRRE